MISALELDEWEGGSPAELAQEWGAPRVHCFHQIGSTNDVATVLAREGAPPGTLVLAEEQCAGRGRGGRSWSSPPGLGLWISLVLHPAPGAEPALLPLRVGLAAARALDHFAYPGTVKLKWPNDLLLGGRKLAGILCEAAWDAHGPRSFVAGIGINVLHTPEDFPAEIRERATSLCAASGTVSPRREVMSALVPRVLAATRDPVHRLEGSLAEEIAARDALRGREVLVDLPGSGEKLRGTARGIAADGALLVRTAEGGVYSVRAGSVRLATAESPAA